MVVEAEITEWKLRCKKIGKMIGTSPGSFSMKGREKSKSAQTPSGIALESKENNENKDGEKEGECNWTSAAKIWRKKKKKGSVNSRKAMRTE